MKILLLAFIFSSTFVHGDQTNPPISECHSVNLPSQPVGFRCLTNWSGTNKIFQRVTFANYEAWMRETDGSTWFLVTLGEEPITQKAAKLICNDLKSELPSLKDFVLSSYNDDFIQRAILSIFSLYEGHYWTSNKGPSNRPQFVNAWGQGGIYEDDSWLIKPTNVICVIK